MLADMKLVAAFVVAFALAFAGVHYCGHASAESAPPDARAGHMMHGAHDGADAPQPSEPTCGSGSHCKACPSGAAIVEVLGEAAHPAVASELSASPFIPLAGFAKSPDPPPPRLG